MPNVNEINRYLNKRAPYFAAKSYDNVGFLAGNGETEVKRVLVALDISLGIVKEAVSETAELIVSHHPVIFSPLKSITSDDWNAKRVMALIGGNVSAICLHTNLDSVPDGVSDKLCDSLGLQIKGVLDSDQGIMDGIPYGFGRIGELAAPVCFADFLSQVKDSLKAAGLRYVDANKPARRVAVCGGSGGDLLKDVIDAGCDTYVTGEVKHSHFLMAADMGINLIETGHFSSENVIVPGIAKILSEGFPELQIVISKTSAQPESYFV